MRMTAGFRELGDDIFTRRDGGASDTLATRRLLVHDVAERIIDAIDGPALLAFEDIQWADELSLEVIGELARLIRDRPILMIAAYRIDELPIGSIHREWRARLLSQRFAEEARLEPLTYEQTALVTTLILDTGLPAPRDVVDAVYRRTDGIPFHIEELLGALGEDARRDDRAILDAKVPETIEDAILARVARLSPEARAVASAGAVIGRCFVPEVLAGVMDRPVADLDGPLDELVANSFLFTFGSVDEGYFDFRHQLLRDALYRTRAGRRAASPPRARRASSAPPSSARPPSMRRSTSSGRACEPRPIARRSRVPARPARSRAGASRTSSTDAPSPMPRRTSRQPSSPPCMRRCPRPRPRWTRARRAWPRPRLREATSLRPATRPWRPNS